MGLLALPLRFCPHFGNTPYRSFEEHYDKAPSRHPLSIYPPLIPQRAVAWNRTQNSSIAIGIGHHFIACSLASFSGAPLMSPFWRAHNTRSPTFSCARQALNHSQKLRVCGREPKQTPTLSQIREDGRLQLAMKARAACLSTALADCERKGALCTSTAATHPPLRTSLDTR